MARNLPAETLYEFITNDFEDAWNSLAGNPSAHGRGTFMFALQAMILLEWAARLCSSDATGAALLEFSQSLKQVEPKYFTLLPGNCPGQAHQYQQIVVGLTDGKHFVVSLTGASFGSHLHSILPSERPSDHLGRVKQ